MNFKTIFKNNNYGNLMLFGEKNMGNKNNSNEKRVRYAKAYGIKGNIVYNGNMYTTTFGNKNDSVICKVYDPTLDKVKPYNKVEVNFDLTSNEQVLNLKKSEAKKINIDNLLSSDHSNAFDPLKIKGKYNKIFFDNEYKNDTVHTQIAYNILDINKITSLYFYNIVYVINNLSRNSALIDDEDIVGAFSVKTKFEDYKVKYCGKDKANNKDISSSFIMTLYTMMKNKNAIYEKEIASIKADINNQKGKSKFSDLSEKTQHYINLKKEKLNEKYAELKEINKDNQYFKTLELIDSDEYKKSFFTFNKYAKSYYSYYPMFKPEPKYNIMHDEYKNNEKSKAAIKNNYNVLRTLSYIRQAIGHTNGSSFNNLLSIDKDLPEDLIQFIDEKFEEALVDINRDFAKNAKVNLNVISYLKDIPYDDNLLNKYYRFSMLKENKNIGINTTRVREELYEFYRNKKGIDFSETKFNSYRPKINLIYDYLIYEYLSGKSNTYVEKLRNTVNDNQKDDIYREIARCFYNDNANMLFYNGNEQVNANINYYLFDKQGKKDCTVEAYNINNYETSNQFSTFSKVIYFMSSFLEKKEKNDLITALINKFDNINSLNKVYRELSHKEVEYGDKYKIFRNASKTTEKLRIVKNLSHMNNNDEDNAKKLYIDALKSLGCENCDEVCDQFMNDETQHPFRNFISNNIITSRRFIYIVKYTNPETIREYIECEKLIKSVLWSIPDSQIDRYCKILNINLNEKHERKVNLIYTQLKEFNYNKLTNYDYNNSNNLEKIKSLVNLYYTVVYISIKNLVNVNSIFTIGLECFERDYQILNDKTDKGTDAFKSRAKELSLLKKVIDEYYSKYKDVKNENFKKKHDYEYLIKYYDTFNNIDHMDEIFKQLRNEIMHLSIVSKAKDYLKDVDLHYDDLKNKEVPVFYELYTYVLERIMLDCKLEDDNKNPLIEKYRSDILKFKTYNKNMLHILFTPLAYNLARYKNLTIRELFYDKYNEKSDFE